jgi:transcriptional regulator with XRE-family HTH domain
MPIHSIATTIRSKKLGALIRDARITSGKSMAECAQALGIETATFGEFELGNASPSLPDLEVLAYYLHIPLEHFWGVEALSPLPKPAGPDEVEKLVSLRQRIIGTRLRQARMLASLSPKEMADRVGLSEEKLLAYELGEEPIPLPELEVLAQAVNLPLQNLRNSRGPIGTWATQQRALQYYLELPPDLQDFISKPVNRPYLELAKRLSEMPVDKLRAVAEGLLEITL